MSSSWSASSGTSRSATWARAGCSRSSTRPAVWRSARVGYWDREWAGETVFETGWSVIPAFQGRGIAGAGTALVIDAGRAERTHRFMYAYPSVDNPPSNAICRKLGFTLLEAQEFEYPPGHLMRCNVWRLDLFAEPA